MINNLQLFSFRFPRHSTTYKTYVFPPSLSHVLSPAKNCCHVFILKGVPSLTLISDFPKTLFYKILMVYYLNEITFSQSQKQDIKNMLKLIITARNSFTLTLRNTQTETHISIPSLIMCVSSMQGRCGKGHTHAEARKSN